VLTPDETNVPSEPKPDGGSRSVRKKAPSKAKKKKARRR